MKLKPKKQKKLDAMAMLCIVKSKGALENSKIDRLIEKVKEKFDGVTQRDIDKALRLAQDRYFNGRIHLFVCDGCDCKKHRGNSVMKKRIADLKDRFDIKVSKTKCQGACGRAPIATIRVGEHSKVFLNMSSKKSWKALEAYLE